MENISIKTKNLAKYLSIKYKTKLSNDNLLYYSKKLNVPLELLEQFYENIYVNNSILEFIFEKEYSLENVKIEKTPFRVRFSFLVSLIPAAILIVSSLILIKICIKYFNIDGPQNMFSYTFSILFAAGILASLFSILINFSIQATAIVLKYVKVRKKNM